MAISLRFTAVGPKQSQFTKTEVFLEQIIRFDNVEVRPNSRQLLVGQTKTALGARAFDLLLALIERKERLVSKNELLDIVWPGLVVEENNLSVQISALRKVLGPAAIATVPGRGYRFTANVEGQKLVPAQRSVDSAHVPSPMATVWPTNLPEQLPAIYGREQDVEAVKHMLQAPGIVSLIGPGGIGKTRLAWAVAHELRRRWPDGSFVVELASLADPRLVPATVAQSLGIELTGRKPALDELIAALRSQSLLLVLDNCEHLLDAVSQIANALSIGAPQVRLLVTSQEPLKVPREQQYRVAPLAVASGEGSADARSFGAVALFEARVRAADPRFAFDAATLGAAVDICRRLDGLALAIELAAVRVPVLGVFGVRDRLDERFQLLTGGSRVALRRHQTLRAAMEWSHKLLTPAEQVVFRRLGTFAGGFSIELARAVAADEGEGDEWAVVDALAALVDKSLVVAQPGEPPRYSMLETPRAFALEQLVAAGETPDCLRRHAQAVADFFERVDGALLDGNLTQDSCAAMLLPETDNLRAAIRWATQTASDWSTATRLAAAMSGVEEFAAECVDLLHLLEARLDVVSPKEAAGFWLAMCRPPLQDRIPTRRQAQAAERATALYATQDQPTRLFHSLNLAALYWADFGDAVAAERALAVAHQAFTPHWPALLRARLITVTAHVMIATDRRDQAVLLFRESLEINSGAGDWRPEVRGRSNLADMLWSLGRTQEACEQLLDLAAKLRQRGSTATNMTMALTNLAGVLSELDRPHEAAEVAREALPFMRRSGLLQLYIESFVYLFVQRQQPATAARLIGACDAFHARLGRQRQPNEQRLIAKARARLDVELNAAEFARFVAEGAALDDAALFENVEAALAAPGKELQ